MITNKTLSVGARGQITLPKKIRDLFKTNAITIEVIDNNHAVISPVPDIAGKLSEFKKNCSMSFEDIRNESWINSISNKK